MPALALDLGDVFGDCVDLVDDLVEATSQHGAAYLRWTPPQDAWLRLNPKSGVKLLRGGNQSVGKTTAAMQEVDWRATGTHPHYRTRPPPVEIWVVCTSWSQSVAIQTKFWELCDRSRLTPETRDRFRPDIGWGKDNPTVLYNCGSKVRFRTTNQGAKALAGSTVHYIHIDEPTTETVFRELRKRLTRSRGQMGMTLTPINWDCGYIREEVERGTINEVHARLTAENLIPIGATRPLELFDEQANITIPMDQAWIDEQRRITPARWAAVVLDGEWEAAPEGVFFHCFDANKHAIVGKLNPAAGPIRHLLGFDYAAADREIGHCAVLCQVQDYRDEAGRTRQRILAVDEVALEGHAANERFAREVLAMLARNGVRWSELAGVHGDNPVTSQWGQKSNSLTMKAIAAELGIPVTALLPKVMSAKDGTGEAAPAFRHGCQWMFERIASSALYVHRQRCPTLVKGLETWDYTKLHRYKDIIDACRYALRPVIFPYASGNVEVRVAGRR